ncbi:MAG: DUF1178 family protein [Rhodocyclaceae bacterium]|nr:DUF1178 family protein [Rhodocyclaceae bacterium]
MIVLDVTCDQGHRFEGWFASSAAFSEQCDQGLVACPTCGSTRVTRLPSAPYVSTTRHSQPEPTTAPPRHDPAVIARQLAASLRAMAAQAEDVGAAFPQEARRIHYGDSERKQVRGQASRREIESLLDEGIGILPVPGDDDLH